MINGNDYIQRDWWEYLDQNNTKMLNLGNIVSNKKTSSSESNIWPFRMLII